DWHAPAGRTGEAVGEPFQRARQLSGRSEAERGRAFLDLLVDLARAGDDDAVDQVARLIAACLDAGRAGPELAAAGEEILDQRLERLKRVHDMVLDCTLAHEIDGGARQKNR